MANKKRATTNKQNRQASEGDIPKDQKNNPQVNPMAAIKQGLRNPAEIQSLGVSTFKVNLDVNVQAKSEEDAKTVVSKLLQSPRAMTGVGGATETLSGKVTSIGECNCETLFDATLDLDDDELDAEPEQEGEQDTVTNAKVLEQAELEEKKEEGAEELKQTKQSKKALEKEDSNQKEEKDQEPKEESTPEEDQITL